MSLLFRPASLVVVSALVATAIGCGPSVQERLVGKWKGTLELDRTAVEQKMADVDPALALLQKAGIFALESNMTFTMDLKADGTLASEVRAGKMGESSAGTWAVKSADRQQATLTVTEKSGTREYVLDFDENFVEGTGGFSMPAWGEFAGLGNVRFTRAAP